MKDDKSGGDHESMEVDESKETLTISKANVVKAEPYKRAKISDALGSINY